MSERLCAICNRIFTITCPRRHGILHTPHHSTLDDLLQAANEGCYICRSITKNYQWSDIYDLFSKGFAITFQAWRPAYYNRSHSDSMAMTVEAFCDSCIADEGRHRRFNQTQKEFNEIKEEYLPQEHTEAGSKSYKFYITFHLRALRPLKNEAIGSYDHIATPSSVLSNPAMMGLLKYWFTECCNSHPFCLPPAPSFNPTRLLLVENEHSARIVETKDWNDDHPYVALSHCWGNANRLKLQKSNMVDLLNHLSITELPTTYREGISVALALGFSYIWIDSLCIIQDDEEDWTMEAAMMKNVFEHCSINLSATAAADSSQSNFRHRDPAIILPLEVTLNQGEEKTIQSSFWLANEWTELRRQDIICSPLHSRAWVFQEANLSRRRIDLARSQMWWLCQQNWACETHPSGVWDVEKYENGDRQKYYDMRKRRDAAHNAPLTTSILRGPNSETPNPMEYSDTLPYQRHWYEQIRVYSNCDITETKDRLIAFTGIAQRYAQDRGRSLDDYLAGIWHQELPRSLCFSSTHGKPSYRPDKYRAPSWSWASLEGPVSWWADGKPQPSEPLCEVVNAKVIHQFERCQAGGVIGGVLHLRGRLIERILGTQVPKWPNDKWIEELADAVLVDDDFDECWNAIDSETPHLRPLRVSYLEHPQGQLDQRKEGIVDGAVRKSISFRDVDELSGHLRLFMLPIIENETDDSDELGGTDVECLILCQTLDDCLAGNDIYQRVGFYDRSPTSWDEGCRVLLEDLRKITVRDVYII